MATSEAVVNFGGPATGQLRDHFRAILPFHQKRFAKPTLHLLDCRYRRQVRARRSRNVAECIHIKLYITPLKLALFVDKKTAIGGCKELFMANRFARFGC